MSALAQVYEAKTEEEKQAIYKLRYEVYIEELQKTIEGADNDNKVLIDNKDLEDCCHLFYTGKPEKPTSSVRVNKYIISEAPDDVAERYSLDLFSEVGDYGFFETARLVVHPKSRGMFCIPALSKAIYSCSDQEEKTYFAFSYCAPGLVELYTRLGYRPYSGKLIQTDDGIRLPMVMVLSDYDYFKQVKSPLAGMAKKKFGSGELKPVDLSKLEHVFGNDSSYETNSESVWSKIQDDLILDDGKVENYIFDELSEQDIKKLSNEGMIVNIATGDKLLGEGLIDREMFVVLSGTFEVIGPNGMRIAVLGAGEPVGELGFFTEEGRRTANVIACEDSTVLVLRRKFLSKLMQKESALAAQLLFNLARIMAERTAKMVAKY